MWQYLFKRLMHSSTHIHSYMHTHTRSYIHMYKQHCMCVCVYVWRFQVKLCFLILQILVHFVRNVFHVFVWKGKIHHNFSCCCWCRCCCYYYYCRCRCLPSFNSQKTSRWFMKAAVFDILSGKEFHKKRFSMHTHTPTRLHTLAHSHTLIKCKRIQQTGICLSV